MADYIPRLADELVTELLQHAPALLLTGPRACGKTTTASRHTRGVIRLDQAPQAEAFRNDPDAALAQYKTPLLIDEWQSVPQILGAVKRAVDADPRPGRFLLTGSVRAELGPATWAGTGRIIRVPIWPMTQRELLRKPLGSGLLDGIAERGVDSIQAPEDPPDLPGYLDLAVAGGLPQAALSYQPNYRRRWYASYLDRLLTQDAAQIAGRTDPIRLRRYLDALAENTAGLPADSALLDIGGVNARTATRYDRLLVALGILDTIPAWSNNRMKRLTLRGKRYLTDTGLTAAALKITAPQLLADGPLFGRLLDAYVTAQIRAEVSASALMPTLYHLRDRDGHEIDLLLDYGRAGVIAIEIKSTAAPQRKDAGHLIWLRERIPRFIAGIVLHTGPRVYELDRDIMAIPIAALWDSPDPVVE
ncbi:MAG: ATP-binding protein [Angustibacter sp.]